MADLVFSYFPGCSLATTAKESNASLIKVMKTLGITLVELEDWNCCGSSSAHSMNGELADRLAMRNLAMAPAGRPLLIACPNCHLHLRQAQMKLSADETVRRRYRKEFGCPADSDLQIVHFLELLGRIDWSEINNHSNLRLKELKFAPYYGCMLARPPAMRHENNYYGLMERILTGLGATAKYWGYGSRCCGTFLSVVRPDVVTAIVREITDDAKRVGADCIITACAMCHMNLELRSEGDDLLPIFHFSEILSLAFGHADTGAYFERHLIDPRPLLKRYRFIP